jgi:mutator family transposase
MKRAFAEVLAVAEGAKEDKASWTAFLRHLKERLKGVRLFVSDKCLGLVWGSFIRRSYGSCARCILPECVDGSVRERKPSSESKLAIRGV